MSPMDAVPERAQGGSGGPPIARGVGLRAMPRRMVVALRDADALPAPRVLFHRAAGAFEPRVLFQACDGGPAFAALGELAAVGATGPQRFAHIAEAARTLAERLEGPPETRALPLLVGGFSFEDTPAPDPAWAGFPAARWAVPRVLLLDRAERRTLALVVAASPGEPQEAIARRLDAEAARVVALANDEADPPAPSPLSCTIDATDLPAERARFVERVREALGAIRSGRVEKLVVARACALARARTPEELHRGARLAVDALERPEPGARLFAWSLAGAVLFGRTPERLLAVRGRSIETEALAGSTRRSEDAAHDAALATALRESKKEQDEHALVVQAIREALAPWCDRLEVPEAPSVRALAGIQHLATPVRARLARPLAAPLFALAQRLHPTPAVAGRPRDAALAWLRDHEGLARGWYAGLVGWASADGDGELAVVLRAAIARDGAIRAFAGAGVVAGSDPEAELAETDLKLGTVARALRGDPA